MRGGGSVRLRFVLLSTTIAAGFVAALSIASSPATAQAPAVSSCSTGFVEAIIGGQPKCLRAGEFCSAAHETDYERYGFTCTGGRLQSGGSAPPVTTSSTSSGTIAVGKTVLVSARSQTAHCTRGVLPDRQCSPGAFYSGLTQPALCASGFRTSSIRHVSEAVKHQVEIAYGLAPRAYGHTIEIDHIIALELGGSNDVANLYPEPGTGGANYHEKDKLENKLHALVCAGSITLQAAQRGIASDWVVLYTRIYGEDPRLNSP